MTRKVKLKEVCREITVGHVGPMADSYVDSGIPFLRSQNVAPFRIDKTNLKFISDDFHKKLKKSALCPGDVVVVRTGYPGTASVIPPELPVSNCADLVVIRPSEQIDGHFLCSLFNSVWGRGHVAGNLVGVAQQHFNIGAAKEMEIALPPITVQRKVTSILSAYDNLIENNTRRIRILEQMAQMLYREWFVNFRFPGHGKEKMVESEMGLIPAKWNIMKVGEILVRLKSSRIYTESDVSSTGSVPVIDQSQDDFLGFHCNTPDHLASIDSPIAIFGDHTCKMRLLLRPFSIGPNVVPFVSRMGLPMDFVFFAVRGMVSTFEYKRHWTDLTSKVVLVPLLDLAERFTRLVNPMLIFIESLMWVNLNLRTTRDLLLPKLVSGEVSVEVLEQEALAEAV